VWKNYGVDWNVNWNVVLVWNWKGWIVVLVVETVSRQEVECAQVDAQLEGEVVLMIIIW
jgi:hypothetical protein